MLNNRTFEVEKLINNQVIFISGGTGTFGHEITKIILNHYTPKKLIIFSRDEFKQYNMKKIYPENIYKNILFTIISNIIFIQLDITY